MKPFISFYGAKWRMAKHYPPPAFDRIIEPFAGSAGYSVYHHQKFVTLNDSDPVICGVWSYLIRATAEELLALPAVVHNTDDVPACQEARWLIGFWINGGSATPKKTPSSWMRRQMSGEGWATGGGQMTWEKARNRLAQQVSGIRHWQVTNRDYRELDRSIEATWFVDPPYCGSRGRQYRHKISDYLELGSWCRGLKGQVIACEHEGATWLPFEKLGVFQSSNGSQKGDAWTAEVIWVRPPGPPSAGPWPA